ncbi:tRNA A64-2'-O-ribosylphosphate transferase isoform X1 [Ipomoea triloba]|uniref:tRNA A64-2'-O-ribosylphosphate transferase isoform X1 n=2 Tax=Ipomoea triloba TaxID=35885 RepID=UPI00125CDE9C|nr:tRNA A64-2'-O-ribosylphosphate transferase isoform X1 [Ipomoea triloba]XP_031091272.1 tRNA A64-2'-O-ribosylphosphate transferase isoform X1 [Ipomoea triloba]
MEDERMENPASLSIYKASRTIKRKHNSLYNALRSIYEDSIFVGEISELWPELPLLANLRCGLWYSPKFHSTCYFKSTDGHTNNWSFNTSRLNLHVALLAGQRGGCMIVDSTRKGKRFPDSMSKTIPIWTCVLNRAIANYRRKLIGVNTPKDQESNINDHVPNNHTEDVKEDASSWDCSLHLPIWVSDTEKTLIEERLDGWTKDLETSGADIASIAFYIKKPLQPLWISQKTVIWLNEVPESSSWDFTPIILVSASFSTSVFQQRTTSEFSWNYISGAGDDEESWARGLTPTLFWKHVYDLINLGPNLCNQKVADIVEKNRVYCAQRGEDAPQISLTSKTFGHSNQYAVQEPLNVENLCIDGDEMSKGDDNSVSWLGDTNVAVGKILLAKEASSIDSILNCGPEEIPRLMDDTAYLHLPIVGCKFDRFSLSRSLPSAINFANINLRKGKRLLVCCANGEDISICVCLAILLALFDDRGCFDEGRSFNKKNTTKLELRQRLVFICKYAVNARPSRGNLKQVFNYLNSGNIGPVLEKPLSVSSA